MKPERKDEELILMVIDGDCSEEEFAEASERLLNDPEFLALYRRMCEFETAFGELFPKMTALEPDDGAARAENAVPFKQAKRNWLPLAAGIAAVLAIGLFLGLRSAASRGGGESLAVEFSPSALVTSTSDGRLPGRLVHGKVLRLEQGHMEVRLPGGRARTVIESPAEFVFSPGGGFEFTEGKAWFDLPEGSDPVRCKVGGHIIEDIGTVFGFTTESGELEGLVVREGAVRVSAVGGGSSRPAVVSGGGGMRIEDGRFVMVEGPDFADYRKAVDRTEGVLEWTAEKDPDAGKWRSTEGPRPSVDGGLLRFSSTGRKHAWLDVGKMVPLSGKTGFDVSIEAVLGSEGGMIARQPAGISLFAGNLERVFIGKRHDRDKTWALMIYSETGDWSGSNIHALGIPDPSCEFRIGYESATGVMTVMANSGKGWRQVFESKVDYPLSFDRIRLMTEDSEIRVKKIAVFSEK